MPENGCIVQPRPRRPPPAPEPIPLDVLYADECLMAVNKPAGMVVHPTYRNWSGTLLNGLLWRVGGEPRIVTRLDKDTSGVVLVALTADIHKRMQRDGAAGRVKKEYLAIVGGTPEPPRGVIEAPLARSRADRRRVVVDAAGRPSRTQYEVISTTDGLSLVRCELLTGRTHQIRVHLASRGWPIAGDAVYGVPHPGLSRHALHAWRVTLPHPITREMLTIEAPLPADLQATRH
ncbi:MAG: RluA family pseudouridine synthase [Acidobacteria bacterium]|nr:RluA family pseudouridine synthase [Acidobacteriota bacterium]